jgi:hypothetical protein
MLRAHVLIQTEVGKVAHVAQRPEVGSWPRTSPAPTTSSPGSRRPAWTRWGRLVVARIQVMDGVTRTLTVTVLHR